MQPIQPVIHVNYLAILLCVVSFMVLGFLWYGPFFGRAWKKEMGVPEDCKPEPKQMTRSMGLMIVGSFLTSFVLTHNMQAWMPSRWHVGADAPAYVYGFFGGFFTWLGFYVPMLFGLVSWENKSWKLFWINAAYYFVALQAAGMILSFLR